MAKENKAVRERISRLIMEIIVQTPCLSLPLIKLPIVHNPDARWPMYISPNEIGYREDLLVDKSDTTLKFILLHEAMHYVQRAPFRITRIMNDPSRPVWADKEAMMMNFALDLAANDILIRAGARRPDDKEMQACIPGEYPFENFPPGNTVEFYFELLMKKNEEMEQQQKEQEKNDEQQEQEEQDDSGKQEGEDSDGESGSPEEGEKNDEGNEEGGGGKGEGDEDEEDKDGENGEGGGEGEEDDERESESGRNASDGASDDTEDEEDESAGRSGGRPGKSKGGNSRGRGDNSDEGTDEDSEESGDEKDEAQGGTGVTADGRLISEMTVEEILREFKDYPVDIVPMQEGEDAGVKEAEAFSALSQMGEMSCGLHSNECLRMAIKKELEPPKIPWKRQLQMLMTKRENARPTYKRPNRRRTGGDIIFPSRNNNTLGDTALVLDSSGSMTRFLGEVAVECHSLISQFPNSKLTIIMGDTVIRKEESYGKGKMVIAPKDWEFKGGGGTDMSLLFKRAMELRVNAIICMTDLVFTFPQQPTVPVIWIVPEVIKSFVVAKRIVVPYGSVIYMEKTK